MNISKSKYARLCRCEKLLWLDTHRHDLAQVPEAVQSRAETGTQVTALARGIFGDYTDVTVLQGDRPDLEAMAAKTAECMEQGVENICEASFLVDGLYCAVDILKKEAGGWAIYEVKSGTKIEDRHILDAAFQTYVLKRSGVTVTGTYLVCINNQYVRGEELELSKLFKVTDVSAEVSEYQTDISDNVDRAKAILAGPEPDVPLGIHCNSPDDCPYWHTCAAHVPEHSVFDLYRMTAKKKWKHYDRGVVSYAELDRDGELNDKQKRQVRFELEDCGTHIDRKEIAKFLKTLSYPLYFLDFEAMQLAIPEFPGTKPNAQIPFQYSLHYIEEPGGELKHTEFLAVSGEDPRRAIAESLCRDIPADACVTAYNKAYECTRLKELAEAYPDLAEHLTAIKKHIKDLLEPFQSGCYYNQAMGGSFSIKSVLPALFPEDPELDYHNLEGVHNGGEAMAIFPRIKDMPPEEQETARQNLLAYCKLDTYAMVKVWQKLCEAAEET